MSVNKEIIPKTNLFNTGSPGFTSEMLRNSKPVTALKGDTIIYRGDVSEEIYFVKSGELEIIAEDDKTVVAILSEGAYFGEVGVLLDMKRTMTVRALTNCILNQIKKDTFFKIVEKYPDQFRLLRKVRDITGIYR